MLNSPFGRLLILLVLSVLFTGTPKASGQVVPETREFYVAAVQDARQNKNSVRILQDSGTAKPGPIEGAAFSDIRDRIQRSFPRRPGLRPVVIQVRELNLSEAVQPDGRIRGQVRVIMRFLLQKENDLLPLTTLSREAVYQRGLTGTSVPFSALNRVLDEGMKYFHSWMDRESSTNIKLARGLKFHFREHQVQHEDTVYYSPDRPLTWADFRDTPRNNRFGAEVFAGFGFDQESYIEDGVVHVTITTRVFVPKSGSWVRPDNRNPYALNHEQRHFDVAKIIAERFRKGILNAGLTLDNYEGFMGPHYFETLRAMNSLQSRYDAETRHGNDHAMQAVWNHKIDQELRESGVKN